jgi:hypothetical protein
MFLLLPVLLPLTVFRPPAWPAARAASCPRIVGTAQGVVLTYKLLSLLPVYVCSCFSIEALGTGVGRGELNSNMLGLT